MNKTSVSRFVRTRGMQVLILSILVLSSLNMGHEAKADISTGLVDYWAFNEGSGLTAGDSAGTANNGTLINGPTWATGKLGSGLSFDGTNDRVNIPTDSIATGTVTVCAWVNPTNPNNWGGLLGNGRFYLGLYLQNNTVQLTSNTSGGGTGLVSPTNSIVANSWQHICAVRNSGSGGAVSLYVNSVLRGTGNSNTPTTGFGLAIGSFDQFNDQPWSGLIDEVRIYNRALSVSDITELYSDGGTNPPPPPTFDFTLSNDGNKSVARSSSVTNTITSTLVTGTTTGVTYTASGLPAATTSSFNPTSCSPTCSTIMTITTGATTPLATSTITVTGTAGSVVKTTSFTLTVTSAPDTTIPTATVTAPLNDATIAGTVSVTATASDNVGVVGVQFLLDGANLGSEDTSSPYSVSWNTTTASGGARVLSARAQDAAGNLGFAANVNVTVDNQAPTGTIVINNGATATNSTASTLTLSATDALSTVTQMRFSNTGSSFSTAENYNTTKAWTLSSGSGTKTVYVQFKDVAGNWSATTSISDTIVLDTTAPTISAVASSNLTSSSATLTWTTNEAATSQIEYGLTTNYGTLTTIDPTLLTSHNISLNGLASSTRYNYLVRSKDAVGNERIGNNNFFNTLAGADTTPPSIPTNLAATVVSPTQINLSWTASTDNVGVTGYNVFRDGIQIAIPATNSYQDTGLDRAQSYTYTVAAHDAATNLSAQSTTANATTPALIITNVTSSNITTTGARITWTTDVPATSAVEYGTSTAYGLETPEDQTLVTTHTINIAGLTPDSIYHYRVHTADADENHVLSADFTFTTLVAGLNGTFVNEVLVTDLFLPVDTKFLPDGRMLILSLEGKIWMLQPGATSVDPNPFLALTDIASLDGRRGLLGLVLDPDFVNNHYYYVFYTDNTNKDRVSRFTTTANNSSTVPNSAFVIYQDHLETVFDHHGGALNFGLDGKLYLTVGDQFDGNNSQDLTTARGKILRLNSDGTTPPGNPFDDGTGPNVDSIWAMGLRNSFRAYIDPVTGRFYIADVGGNDWGTAQEEIDLGVAGANYGWPACEGTSCVNNPLYTPPIHAYAHNGRDASITGGFVYHGNQFPSAYRGNYFFADYTQNWIRRLAFDQAGNVTGAFNFEPADGTLDGPYGDIVALSEGSDGALYYVDLAPGGIGQIRRIRYISSDQPPIALSAADVTDGPAPLTVSFSSAGSMDPEAQLISYLWDFGDSTSSTEANPVHTYSITGQFTVRLTVSDGTTSSLSNPITIKVGTPPTATVLTPQNGIFLRAGDVISFSGDGSDADDGTLPESAFTWTVDFLHGGHTHPGPSTVGSRTGTYAIPTAGHDYSGDTRYQIRLIVTDSDGLQATQSVIVWPEKVNLTFNTVPGNLNITIDSLPHATPYVLDTLIGFNHVINAPNQAGGQSTYTFASWSDSGIQQHTITVPTTDATYTATYTAAQSSNLVASYNFDQGTGSTLSDSSTNGNNGSISGATWNANGKYGGALSFDGSNDLVTIADSSSLDLTNAFTLEAWVNASTTLSGWIDVVYKGNDIYFLEASSWAGPAIGLTSPNGGTHVVTSGSALVPGTWTHLAATYDGSTLSIYTNGVFRNSYAVTGTLSNTTNPLTIGGDPIYGQYFTGLIDNVRVYNTALTQTEIQTDMNTGF